MDACLETGVDYLDTANYEPRDTAKFEYTWQWAYHERFREKGLMALLGSGFDPGVTNVFTAYAAKHHLDEIQEIDIIDANAGSHGQPFATNFNPEINIREVTAPCRHWEDGAWVETPALATKRTYDFPESIGPMDIYRMYHEEMESLVKHFPTIRKAQFWMTFSDNYLKHLEVLQNVGMTRIDPVLYEGQADRAPAVPQGRAPRPRQPRPPHQGQDLHRGGRPGPQGRNGQAKQVYIYNICDHEEAYRETNSQAISYTTGVPAMVGAKMMLTEKWRGAGVFNMEQFDPDPFLARLATAGLPWTVVEGSDWLSL